MQRNYVRTLSDALAIDNQLASAALDHVRALKTKLTKATECQKSFNELNEAAGRRSDSVLTGEAGDQDHKTKRLGLSDQWASDLHEDNTQLRQTLTKFQAAIDLIMQKHRAQVLQFLENASTLQHEVDIKVHAVDERNTQLELHAQKQEAKIEEMLQVMCLAVTQDAKSQAIRDMELQRLRTENEGLREILNAAQPPSAGPDAPATADDSAEMVAPVTVSDSTA
eukprot:m.190082 g.190082  ORF g.190082 m.190082 type:complete len:224 (+) comp24874_c0_seq2:149-820(+)